MAEALTSYLGMGNIKKIGRSRQGIALKPGDQILLCSDGLYKSLTENEILHLVTEYQENVQHAAEALTAAAMGDKTSGQDNTSVVLLRYKEKKE